MFNDIKIISSKSLISALKCSHFCCMKCEYFTISKSNLEKHFHTKKHLLQVTPQVFGMTIAPKLNRDYGSIHTYVKLLVYVNFSTTDKQLRAVDEKITGCEKIFNSTKQVRRYGRHNRVNIVVGYT